ncbi:hypothetical protein CLV59_105492 [Chitinophaga dinghuensis]|uniref:Uncharacterized protein n=1 Tax=Chitinophaga dinghuensis TaxID=1539050 RepID=A0A327VYF4_9BACT|nr:hypothetical protein [Chitinophaga dinghuensis]RAJ80383.1 hypothetical protein CLV59_105492 [Chitinophaga dinghuensis]
MFNNTVLDVFIGLIFIYLLYSLLATILQEMFSRWLSLRTHNLTYAIRVMLEDRKELVFKNPALAPIGRFLKTQKDTITHFFVPFPDNTLANAFYKHPTIKYLGESQWKRKPAYIHPETFSQTLIQILRGESYDATEPQINRIEDVLFRKNGFETYQNGRSVIIPIDSETLRHLRHIFLDSQRDIERFRILLENWFNETMDRAAGWYKRSVQLMLLIIGLALAISFNIDTIAIYKLLSRDKTVREQMVQLAIADAGKYKQMVESMSPKDSANARKLAADSDSLRKQTLDSLKTAADRAQNLFSVSEKYQSSDVNKWLGRLLTALAISLGAPFWFDLLNKLIQLRSTGPKPATAPTPNTTEPQKDINSIKRVG